jgi:hypothetical protein
MPCTEACSAIFARSGQTRLRVCCELLCAWNADTYDQLEETEDSLAEVTCREIHDALNVRRCRNIRLGSLCIRKLMMLHR